MSGAGEIGPPEKLSAAHDLSGFDSGEPALDDWLRRRAMQNEVSGASRTYVVSIRRKVVGYYTLAVGAIAHVEVAGRIRRNMPDPVLVMVLAASQSIRPFIAVAWGLDSFGMLPCAPSRLRRSLVSEQS